jgi:hypothetical protein
VQHFFVARLANLDVSARGGYELDRVDLLGNELVAIDLKPTALKEFILANREALLAEVGTVA